MALPVGAVTIYLILGSPDMPGQPLAQRVQAQNQSAAVQDMIAKVEDHVARNPDDGRAWEVLAPVYMRVGRYDDAVRAFRNVLRLNGSNAAHEADLGEALVFAANGVVTDEAKKQFDRALALDSTDIMARFYTGMAADQDGRRAEAEKIWRGLLAEAPPGAPWVELVTHALNRQAPAARQRPRAPGAARRPPITMPMPWWSGWPQRLKKDGSDVQGWLELVRSYRVLNQNDKMEGGHRRRPQGAGQRCRQARPVRRRARSGESGGAHDGSRSARARRRRAGRAPARGIDRGHGGEACRAAEKRRLRRARLGATGALLSRARPIR